MFEGKVIDVRMVFGSEHGWLFPAPEYEFIVTKAWKGISSPRLRLLGGYSNCAFLFRRGSAYLVYASNHWEKPGRLSSSICDRTQLLAKALPDVAALGAAKVAFQPSDNGMHRQFANRFRAYAVGGLSVYANIARHPTDSYAWRSIGAPSLLLITIAIMLLVAGIALHRRRRKAALGLFTTAIILLAVGVIAAGAYTFSTDWFARYLD